jgi:G3E family GTPase
MQITIAGGLPGAEKKNTIFAISKEIASKGGNVVIIITETDGSELKNDIIDDKGIHIREMISSCVPCTFQFDLITEIEKVIEISGVQHIVVELPFSSIPNDVKEALENMKFADMTFAPLVYVIDAMEIEPSVDMIPKLIITQIANSQILSVNTDKASVEKIAAIGNTLKIINSSANIIEFSMKSKGKGFENLITSLIK